MSEAWKWGKKKSEVGKSRTHLTSLTSMDPKKELAKGVELVEAKSSNRMENNPLSSSESLRNRLCIRHCWTEDVADGELLISNGE